MGPEYFLDGRSLHPGLAREPAENPGFLLMLVTNIIHVDLISKMIKCTLVLYKLTFYETALNKNSATWIHLTK